MNKSKESNGKEINQVLLDTIQYTNSIQTHCSNLAYQIQYNGNIDKKFLIRVNKQLCKIKKKTSKLYRDTANM